MKINKYEIDLKYARSYAEGCVFNIGGKQYIFVFGGENKQEYMNDYLVVDLN